MRIERQLEQSLNRWCVDSKRKPLLLRGARQVGKSYLIESFSKKRFPHVITINFELAPEFKNCFATLKPVEICDAIGIITQQSIIPGKTLLFLDEIQDCPQAIQALRYFKELMPELHVIGAGSLLELTLRESEFRMPVGRVEFLHCYPLSFKEFLTAINPEALESIKNCTVENPLPLAIHEHLLKQLKLYLWLGGMPEVLSQYIDDKNMQAAQAIQESIIETYRKDLGHFSKFSKLNPLKKCFEKIPMMLAQQIKYNKIDPDLLSRDIKQALTVLEDVEIFHRIYSTSAKGLPLDASINDKKFKLNFIDVGLVKRFNQLDINLLLNEDIMLLNKGALAEQFVGQELLAYSPSFEKSKLYFWARDGHGTAEVDYVRVIGSNIFPIEVKSGKLGKLKSLKQYLQEHNCPFGIRISQAPLSLHDDVLSVPLYMISELERLAVI